MPAKAMSAVGRVAAATAATGVTVLSYAAYSARHVRLVKTGPAKETLLAQAVEVPESGFKGKGDCFRLDVPGHVPIERFVHAFFTSWLFKLERLVLPVATTDSLAKDFAYSRVNEFAIWTAKERTDSELLATWAEEHSPATGATWMRVVHGKDDDGKPKTCLEFGSAIATGDMPYQKAVMAVAMPLHLAYSGLLLGAAAGNIDRTE
ncbi:hypothetical protein FNF27_03168 [Cafeteria roenbergensis]|uniref:Coenzyme Q-binding protein COQ10 START domain-containing protein n=1 Tax=Cafeteria roenbergensis TaxID=33653 RepID=A0A5A8EDY0_CAFRO|nr:hypothetical protein FNF27_03168 [Cafeteria roenbergensis]